MKQDFDRYSRLAKTGDGGGGGEKRGRIFFHFIFFQCTEATLLFGRGTGEDGGNKTAGRRLHVCAAAVNHHSSNHNAPFFTCSELVT